MLRETVVASLFLAAVVIVASMLFKRLDVGMGLAAGLVIGSANGYLLVASLGRRAPFVAASMVRLALLTSTALVVALVLHSAIWAVALGVGVAQIVMTAVAVRAGLRS